MRRSIEDTACLECGGRKKRPSKRCRACYLRAKADWQPRFWAKVDRSGGPDACWPWTGRTDDDGYGRTSVAGKRGSKGAHRVAWELVHGPVPPGLVLDHLACDNPPCCNPSHLDPTTNHANLWRGKRLQLNNPEATCRKGHAMTIANSAVRVDGAGKCRACHAEYMLGWKKRRATSHAA